MKKLILVSLLVLLLILTAYYFYPEEKLLPGVKADKLIVWKSKGILQLYSKGTIAKTYNVSIGQNPSGDKVHEGDKRTPEGEYIINDRNPNSTYYKNLGISYPNKADIEEAKKRNVNPGGAIKIHGLKNGLGFIGKFHRLMNWTAGCIAITNEEIDELYRSVSIGTPIIIKP